MANILETIAKVMADENGTDYEQELADAQAFARIEREIAEDERKARQIKRAMQGYVEIRLTDFN